MFSINNVKTFKDSVHGYIEVPTCFVDNLIDNEYFQRLRNVEQTGMRILYPNAKHDRFSHSLGVFHLGSKAVDALLENFSKDQYWNIESDSQSILFWAKNKILFLIACLLHDIGHAPFSHALETQILQNSCLDSILGKKEINDLSTLSKKPITYYLEKVIAEKEREYMLLKYGIDSKIKLDISNKAPHEQIGALLLMTGTFSEQIIKIFYDLHQNSFPRPEGESILYAEYYKDKIVVDKVDKKDKKSMTIFWDDLCFIARMILGLKYEEWRPERQIRNCFIELLNGENFDVDKLDYIVRDTQMSGINNISVDVDRLLSSLCIVTKTRHLNKLELSNKKLRQITILDIKNYDSGSISAKRNNLSINGEFHGSLIISRGARVTIMPNSNIESFSNLLNGEAKIRYLNANRAQFNKEAYITQKSEIQTKIDSGDDRGKIIQLEGNSTKPFSTLIKKAQLISYFYFEVIEDIRIKIHGKIKINIDGAFYSESFIKVYNAELNGDISEVEILSDTFKQDFTKTKVPGEYGFNTFAIGFKKQAINVIANVIDARNYLYLWIYAHHKVIYYANYLIPVLTQELLPTQSQENFPTWGMNFDNIKVLDDTYIWTAIRYIRETGQWKNKKRCQEIKALINEFLTRKYKRSLYKSLAEFDLYFEKYDEAKKIQLQKYIIDKCIDVKMPLLKTKKMGNEDITTVGYFCQRAIGKINEKIKQTIQKVLSSSETTSDLIYPEITVLVYVSADYKRKELKTLKTFIDMTNDIISISQIPLLETQTKRTDTKNFSNYFYLYYDINLPQNYNYKVNDIVNLAVKEYFDDIVGK